MCSLLISEQRSHCPAHLFLGTPQRKLSHSAGQSENRTLPFKTSSPARPHVHVCRFPKGIPTASWGTLNTGRWRASEAEVEEGPTLLLKLGHTTELSRELAEGEGRRGTSMPAQRSCEGASKERRSPLESAPGKGKVALSNVRVESSSEWAAWSGGTSGEGSRMLVTEWEILLSVAPTMVLKAHVLCFTNVNALLSQVSQFRGRQNTVRVQFSLNCHC